MILSFLSCDIIILLLQQSQGQRSFNIDLTGRLSISMEVTPCLLNEHSVLAARKADYHR